MSPQARSRYVAPDLAEARPEPFRVSRSRDRVRKPWKNGRGWTEDVAIYPSNATLDTFEWRVSIAGTDQSGPFSLFPGVDRSIVLLTGRVNISIDGAAPIELAPHFTPLPLKGEASVAMDVCDAPIVDLNVFTRRDRFRHSIKRGESVDSEIYSSGGGVILLVEVATRDALILEQPASPARYHFVGPTYVIEIQPE